MIAKAKKLLKDNSGVAMIYSLVIGIVVAIFAVMLLMVSYALYAQTSRQTGQTQCRVMADTFAESLAAELMDNESELHKYVCERFVTSESVELEYNPTDINYLIKVKLSYELVGSSDDDEDIDFIDDNDLLDGEIQIPEPGSVTPPSGLLHNLLVSAEVTCFKGGVSGIGVQSYTVTQKCTVNTDD